MERFAIRRPRTATAVPHYVDSADNRWRIDAIHRDAGRFRHRQSPAGPDCRVDRHGELKDPYLSARAATHVRSYAEAGQFSEDERERMHATADIYNVGITMIPTWLAMSRNGGDFEWVGKVLDVGQGWVRYQARLKRRRQRGRLRRLLRRLGQRGGDYQERCALGVERSALVDERQPRRPVDHRRRATGSLRYFDAVPVGDELYVYYEATDDAAHESRLVRLPRP